MRCYISTLLHVHKESVGTQKVELSNMPLTVNSFGCATCIIEKPDILKETLGVAIIYQVLLFL